jgi:hypothetical protein
MLTQKEGQNRSQNGLIGAYAMNNNLGIRDYPYSTDMRQNPLTYASIKGVFSQHAIGTVWATMLFEVYWNLVDANGFSSNFYDSNQLSGNIMAIQIIIGGLTLQPCLPSFINARDSIIAADQSYYRGRNNCLIWKGFAKRGLGEGSSSEGSNYIESYEIPADCFEPVETTTSQLGTSTTEPNSTTTESIQESTTDIEATTTEQSAITTESIQESTTEIEATTTEQSANTTESIQESTTENEPTTTEQSATITESIQKSTTEIEATTTEQSANITESIQESSTEIEATTTEQSANTTESIQESTTEIEATTTEQSVTTTESIQESTTEIDTDSLTATETTSTISTYTIKEPLITTVVDVSSTAECTITKMIKITTIFSTTYEPGSTFVAVSTDGSLPTIGQIVSSSHFPSPANLNLLAVLYYLLF